MNTLDYIKQRFAFIGTITDEGASDFALDFGIELKVTMFAYADSG